MSDNGGTGEQVAAGLILVALAAAYLPARRAASADPIMALRTQ